MNTKIKKLLSVSWFRTIVFNFQHLPLKQAVKLPIFLFAPYIIYARKTRIVIDADVVTTGMIQLGYNMVPPYPGKGIVIELGGVKYYLEGIAF